MASPYFLPLDTTISAPNGLLVAEIHGGGTIGTYRWIYVTAIKNGRESVPSNLGDVHGDVPDAALVFWTKQGDPDKFRVYYFNCFNASGLFDPHTNNDPATMQTLDGTAPLVRFKEINAVPDNHGPWPPETEDRTHELLFVADSDGTDFFGGLPVGLPTGTLTAVPAALPEGGGAVNVTWTSRNATSATADGIGPIPLNGSQVVTIVATTTWTLRLTNARGTTILTASTTVGGVPPTPEDVEGVVAAVKVYARAAAASAEAHTLVIGDAEIAITIPTSDTDAGVPTGVRWGILDEEDFNALEFGVERGTAGGAVNLFACCGEILHETPNPALADWEGEGKGYHHRVGSYVGNGTFLDVSGLPFPPKAVLIKKIDGASGTGLIRLGRMGGTIARAMNSGTIISDGIQNLLPTGFELGPNSEVNESGVSYIYLAIQDGQHEGAGPYFTDAIYFREPAASKVVTLSHVRGDVASAWEPELILAFGNLLAVLRTTDMAADQAMELGSSTVTTGLISAITGNSFTVGNSGTNNLTGANSLTPIPVIAWRRTDGELDLSDGIAWGRFAGTGSPVVVTDIPFQPQLIAADHRNAGFTGRYRHRLVGAGGTTSYNWIDGNTAADGITAIGTDGFTVAAGLSINGQDTFWFVFVEALDGDDDDGEEPVDPEVPEGTLCAGGGMKIAAGAPDGTPGCTDC